MTIDLDKLVSLCKRRGFIFQSSEIYGGLGQHVGLRARSVSSSRTTSSDSLVANVRMGLERHDVVGSGRRHPDAPGGLEARQRTHRAASTTRSSSASQLPSALPRGPASPRRSGGARSQTPRRSGGGRNPVPRSQLRCRPSLPRVRRQAHAARACSTSCSRPTCRSGADRREQDVHLRPETAQGIFVNFNNVVTVDATQASVWHRADWQGVPQRDYPRATSYSARASSRSWRLEFFVTARRG